MLCNLAGWNILWHYIWQNLYHANMPWVPSRIQTILQWMVPGMEMPSFPHQRVPSRRIQCLVHTLWVHLQLPHQIRHVACLAILWHICPKTSPQHLYQPSNLPQRYLDKHRDNLHVKPHTYQHHKRISKGTSRLSGKLKSLHPILTISIISVIITSLLKPSLLSIWIQTCRPYLMRMHKSPISQKR